MAIRKKNANDERVQLTYLGKKEKWGRYSKKTISNYWNLKDENNEMCFFHTCRLKTYFCHDLMHFTFHIWFFFKYCLHYVPLRTQFDINVRNSFLFIEKKLQYHQIFMVGEYWEVESRASNFFRCWYQITLAWLLLKGNCYIDKCLIHCCLWVKTFLYRQTKTATDIENCVAFLCSV